MVSKSIKPILISVIALMPFVTIACDNSLEDLVMKTKKFGIIEEREYAKTYTLNQVPLNFNGDKGAAVLEYFEWKDTSISGGAETTFDIHAFLENGDIYSVWDNHANGKIDNDRTDHVTVLSRRHKDRHYFGTNEKDRKIAEEIYKELVKSVEL